MELNLNGNIYIHFIRSIFSSNNKVGIEFILDTKKSDIKLINGLNRLGLLQINKFCVMNNNYPKDLNIINTKYLSYIDLTIIDNNIKINSIELIKKDIIQIPEKKVNTSIYLNKYITGKNKIVSDIMKIINEEKN